AAQRIAQDAVRHEEDDGERHGGDDEGVELAQGAQELGCDDEEDGAQHPAEDGAAAAEHRGDDDLHVDADVDHLIHRGGAEIEHEHGAGDAGEERADDEGGELMLGNIEAQRLRLDRILAAGLEDEADRRTREAEEDEGADDEEDERVPVVGGGVDRQHVGNGHADLAACDAGEDDDRVLQQQHGNESDEAEIGSAQPERRQRQQQPADHRDDGAGDDADNDRQAPFIIEDGGGIGAEANEEGGAEIDLAGE